MITDYLGVKNALTKDSVESANTFAKKLSADLRAVPMDKFTPSQRDIWMEHYEVLLKNSDHIGSSAEIKHQRKHFADLSTHLYKLLDGLKINTTALFYQYCPMADAYWISETSQIANPYYGRSMSTCGSTKNELPAIKEQGR